jgi:hypothetical protein
MWEPQPLATLRAIAACTGKTLPLPNRLTRFGSNVNYSFIQKYLEFYGIAFNFTVGYCCFHQALQIPLLFSIGPRRSQYKGRIIMAHPLCLHSFIGKFLSITLHFTSLMFSQYYTQRISAFQRASLMI